MTHGFLIITHFPPAKVLAQVKRMARQFNTFFIHFNKRNKLDEDDPALVELRSRPDVEVLRERVKIQWGSFGMPGATLALMRAAVKHKNIQYLHLISSECLHVKNFDYIDNFLLNKNNKEYLHHFRVLETENDGWGPWRYDRYHIHKYFDQKGTGLKDILLRKFSVLLHKSQSALKKIGIYRRFPSHFPELYGGSAWWSLTHNCCSYILDFIDNNPYYLQRFQHTALADEMFFHTIIMASPFAGSVVNNNLRYFSFRHGPHATALTMQDIEGILQPDIIIARKFTSESEELFQYLKVNTQI